MSTSALPAPLWRGNPLLVRGIGLSPVLVVSDRLVVGMAMGLLVLLLMLGASAAVALARPWLLPRLRFPCYALMLAALATVLDLAVAASSYSLHQSLGIYPQVAAASTLVLARLEDCAMHAPVRVAAADALAHGLGCLWVAMALGALREWLAWGAPGHGLWLPAGGAEPAGLAVAALPAGAFLALAALQAASRLGSGAPAGEPPQR